MKRTQELTIGYSRQYQTTEAQEDADRWVEGFKIGVEEVMSKVESPSDTGWFDPNRTTLFLKGKELTTSERVIKIGLALKHLNPIFLRGFFPVTVGLVERLASDPRLDTQTMQLKDALDTDGVDTLGVQQVKIYKTRYSPPDITAVIHDYTVIKEGPVGWREIDSADEWDEYDKKNRKYRGGTWYINDPSVEEKLRKTGRRIVASAEYLDYLCSDRGMGLYVREEDVGTRELGVNFGPGEIVTQPSSSYQSQAGHFVNQIAALQLPSEKPGDISGLMNVALTKVNRYSIEDDPSFKRLTRGSSDE